MNSEFGETMRPDFGGFEHINWREEDEYDDPLLREQHKDEYKEMKAYKITFEDGETRTYNKREEAEKVLEMRNKKGEVTIIELVKSLI